ncbi:HEPN domain-containing protein [Thermatribacter velox]|uniref:HEPN domain-containing protein n=1 Tax=Thermatribacter velox TaxID=3039681 RepID=A0ABZ2YA48_9BACT
MKDEIERLISKARKSLEAAKMLFQEGYYGFAASRAYYAMFYAAEASLLKKGLSFSKHSGVISAFGKHFAKPRIIPSEYHKMLRDAFRVRNIGGLRLRRRRYKGRIGKYPLKC